jgi:hypothetical protein
MYSIRGRGEIEVVKIRIVPGTEPTIKIGGIGGLDKFIQVEIEGCEYEHDNGK